MQFSVYDSLLQTCDILTVLTCESAMIIDLRPHVIFAISWQNLWRRGNYDW